MNQRFRLAAVLAVIATLSVLSGCGSQPKEPTVSIIDEEHFESLASVEDAAGNASTSVEILADGPAAGGMGPAIVTQEPAAAPRLRTPPPAPEPAPAPTEAAAPAPAAQQGVDVPFNEKVQIALRNAGYYDGAIDGRVGSKTIAAIKSFQSANNLHADGKVGTRTWEVLKQYYR